VSNAEALALSRDEIRRRIGLEPTDNQHSGAEQAGAPWREPKPLPDGLSPVESFDPSVLPESIAPWVSDISDRLQCPPDYVAVSVMTALGGLIGRRVGIKPQVKTDWVEVPNVWGGFIGRPGMLKSPAMNEALKPLHHIEGEAAKAYEAARRAHVADLEAFKMKKSVKAQMAKDALKAAMERKLVDLGTVKTAKAATLEADAFDVGEPPQEPVPVRYRTCDSTYEALTELLIGNPTGILIERDELVSLLKYLDREEHAVARGFYLSGWSGLQPYTLDRIGRGQRHVEGVCVSILGNTQPAKIGEYVRRANADGAGGDGLIQRFGLLVWPDHPGEWHNVDRYPDSDARTAAWDVFGRLAKLDLNQALAIGAHKDQYDKLPFLRFDESASADFLDWRGDLEQRLRAGEMSPALEGHIAKYRKLVPALALINHLADSGDGPVGIEALLKALAFSRYLESHARRVYGASGAAELAAARAILARIRKGALSDGFSARDVQRHGWSGLTDCEHVQLGLDLLVDLDHLAAQAVAGTDRGGRPKITYAINPRGRS
jgi:putative DNA primase/helicase